MCLWCLAHEFGARSPKLHLGPRRGVKQRSLRHQCSGPATCGAREWSQSARRMLCATGSTRRVDVAGAWRANLRAPQQVEPTYAHLAQHVRSAAEGTSSQATDEHGPECRWMVQPRHRNSRTHLAACSQHAHKTCACTAPQNKSTCSTDPLVMFHLWRVPQLATTPNAHLQECVTPTQSYPRARAPCSLLAFFPDVLARS